MKKILVSILVLSMVSLSAMLMINCDSSILDDDAAGEMPVSALTLYTTETGLADNTVTDIVVDHIRKGVWCATLNGVSFYSHADSTWTTYGADYDIPNMETTSLEIDYMTGRVWLGTVSGPAYFENDEWYALADMESLVHRYVSAIAAMNNGAIWYGTLGGASELDYVTGWTSYTSVDGLAGDLVSTIEIDSFQNVWFGTKNGISVFDGETWTQYGSSVLSDIIVNAIYKSSSGAMWCGMSAGINVYDGDIWSRYGTSDGLPSQAVNDLAEDRNGTMWAATDNGIAQLIEGKWYQLELPDEVNGKRVLCVSADIINGSLWIGTTGGVVEYSVQTEQ